MAMQVDFLYLEKKEIDIPKTTTTMSIRTVNHGMNCIKGLVGFCILRVVPWLSVQERILEFRLSPKMYDDDDEMELTQSARLLAHKGEQV